jgi:putative hydrolase of the HAD superfamily
MSDKWVLLDAMGVIFEEGDDVNRLLIPFIRERDPSITGEQIDDLYMEASAGHITAPAFWQGLGLGDQYPEIEERYLSKCLRLSLGFRTNAQKLLHKYSLAMISNDVAEWSAFLRDWFDIDRYFRVIVVSGEVGHRKPDPAIFKNFLERAQAEARDCVLVDDRARNLHAAAELGFKTILFMREDSEVSFKPDAIVRGFDELPAAVDVVLRG